ncbi:MAG TPA: response regulator transcription factor [Blastocatellia bacterium]|nr:response regulator transcription factor [Blastocatellia bacterium]
MTRTPVILAVGDDPRMLRTIRSGLRNRGQSISTTEVGAPALAEINRQKPDLILLVLAEPATSKMEYCRGVRAISEAPIVVVASNGSEAEKVMALDMGADDYLSVPFGMDELAARVRALLRRTGVLQARPVPIELGGFQLDPDSRRLVLCGREIKLTPKEFDVLRYLLISNRRTVTHRELLSAVWGPASAEQTDYLRVFIKRLRNKIEPDSRHPTYILTVPWVGYRFEPQAISNSAADTPIQGEGKV